MNEKHSGCSIIWLVTVECARSFLKSNGLTKFMFDPRQYVPVLRWKSSERTALCNLDGEIKKRITPIFELVPRDFEDKPTASVLARHAKQVAESWGWNHLFFIDFSLLGEGLAAHCLPIFVKEADARNLRVGLTTELHWSENYQTVVKKALAKPGRELCFRLRAYDLRSAGIQKSLDGLLGVFDKLPSDVHLVVDFQSINEPLPDIAAYIKAIQNFDEWRSFTVIAGAFPKDLSEIEKHSQYNQPRNDWLIWKKYATDCTGRIPSFGDYTIQHGIFEEHEGEFLNFSASIRYTASEYWAIMRGESVFSEKGAGFAQFPAQAQLLLLRPDFCGASFSDGDLYILTMSQQFTKSGSAKDWLTAGFNHHLTFVVRQLDDFFAGSSNSAPSTESNPSQHTLQA